MSDIQIPVDCPVDNPYVKGHLLPDIITGNDMTEVGETVELLPELSGALEVISSVSGRYGEVNGSDKSAEPIIKSLGCETCTLAGICPAPEALRNSIENINGFGALNEIVSAAESEDVISRIWLEKTKAEVYEEGLTDDQLSFRIMKKVEEQGVSVEKSGEKNIFVIKNGKEDDSTSKEVAIIDASGDVEKMVSEGDRGSRVISKEIQTILNYIANDDIGTILDNYRTLSNVKTADGKLIYKTNDGGTGAYRMFFSLADRNGRTWVIITGAAHHDDQDKISWEGLPKLINTREFVNSVSGVEQ